MHVCLMEYSTHHIKSTHRTAQIARDGCFFSLVSECNITVAAWRSHIRARNNYTDAIREEVKITALKWPFLVEWHTSNHTVIYHYRDEIRKNRRIFYFAAALMSEWASSGCTAKQLTAICVNWKIGEHYSEHSICHHKNWNDFISAFIFRSAFAKVHFEYE